MELSSFTRTRARRVLLAAVPVAIATAVLGGGVAQGAVPVSFAISNVPFKISATTLDGTGFSQYAGVAYEKGGTSNPAPDLVHPVAIANIKSATLANLCQSIVMDTELGKVGLLINAGTAPGKPAEASDLQIAMTDLKGTATFSNIRIGVDASTVNTAVKGDQGDFAMDSDKIVIDGLQQESWSTSASTFKLTDLHLQVTDGTECF
ncbi:DUF6230 family protein [Antribacter gilvus]|uniref:DUF6230 family protein n=1 Tax=Antribacter gilvus TaxID=2304675 RepID=UPI000F77D792|nr:DUF6230 family protein [Antribacter gilvus]